MAVKKTDKTSLPNKLSVNAPANSPMGKFHKAMQKIVSVPKSKLKDK